MTERPVLVERMRRFGNTIFGEMSALAVATGSINLGQGFPDTDGPASLLAALVLLLAPAQSSRRGQRSARSQPRKPLSRSVSIIK